MVISLIIFNVLMMTIPDMIPYSLFIIFVGYDNTIELNIIISYIPVHSIIITALAWFGR